MLGAVGADSGSKLQPQWIVDVPLKEVSGICFDQGRGGRGSLLAVGDRVAIAARLDLARVDDEALDWELTPIERLAGSRLPRRDPQVEAIAVDRAGRVLLLQETPPRAELVDLSASRTVASFTLEVPGDDEVATSWSDPDGSRGEGVLLLADGHLLVAKEKKPSALIEFGPPGSRPRGLPKRTPTAAQPWPVRPGAHRYVALAVWQPDASLRTICKDFSDLDLGPDGRLYVLSDKSASIARLGTLARGGGVVSAEASWTIRGLKGKPEGLAFAPDGRAVVGMDTKKARRNLAVLEPAIATTRR
jgi:hypothetical protein